MRRTIPMIALSALAAALTLCSVAITSITADADEGRAVTLYADQSTGQVFMKPCRRCVRLGNYIPAGSTQEIERKVEMKTKAQLEADHALMEAELQNRQLQQQQWNAEMAKQVSEIQPFAREFGEAYPLLNFEQDLGNPGFRQNKRSYGPLHLTQKLRLDPLI